MEVLCLAGGPVFIAAAVTAQACIFNGDKTFGNGGFHAFFLDLLEHVGIGSRIDFKEMASHVTSITGNGNSGLACLGHVTVDAARALLRVTVSGIALGYIGVAGSAIVFGKNRSGVGIVAGYTGKTFVDPRLQFVDLLVMADKTAFSRRLRADAAALVALAAGFGT